MQSLCWKLAAGVYECMKATCRKHWETDEDAVIGHLENQK